ncbi:MAG: glycoside hydrolase family 130 protein [Ignavibacteriales bacterium]|nr:glycoside hydrolase family 130 protein [Ignavibacteriales bacterium]
MLMDKYSENPIITVADVPFRVNSIFNPGAVKANGEYILLCRIEMPTGRSSFLVARSTDGIKFKVEDKPCLTPGEHGVYNKYTEWGIEDPRVVQFGDSWFITYTGYSKFMPLVMLAETKDFKEFKIHGPISEPSNKDCAIFPEKINGRFWKMDRPSAETRRDIWLSSSPDMIHWGNYQMIIEPEVGTWENDKIGGSTPPIRTDAGWLVLYHGVRGFGVSTLYKIGCTLLDINEPWKVIGKTKEPVLTPEMDYERTGDVNNVVFANGWVAESDGTVKVYYSGADTNICLATTTIDELIASCTA